MHFVGWCHTCSQFTFGMFRYFILVSVWEQTCWVVLYGHAQYEQWKSVKLLFRYVLLWLGMCDTTQCFKSNQTISISQTIIHQPRIAQIHLVFYFESFAWTWPTPLAHSETFSCSLQIVKEISDISLGI